MKSNMERIKRHSIRILFTLLFCICYICNLLAKTDSLFTKVEVTQNYVSKNIELNITFVNKGDIPIILYKPSIRNICNNLMSIELVSIKNQTIHDYFPCQEILDIESIEISLFNSVCLRKNEQYVQTLTLDKHIFSKKLEKGLYKLNIYFKYGYDIFFTNEKIDIFKKDILFVSNQFEVE